MVSVLINNSKLFSLILILMANFHSLYLFHLLFICHSGSTVRCLKGYSNTAVGLAVADITSAILRNTLEVKTISTLMQVNLLF